MDVQLIYLLLAATFILSMTSFVGLCLLYVKVALFTDTTHQIPMPVMGGDDDSHLESISKMLSASANIPFGVGPIDERDGPPPDLDYEELV